MVFQGFRKRGIRAPFRAACFLIVLLATAVGLHAQDDGSVETFATRETTGTKVAYLHHTVRRSEGGFVVEFGGNVITELPDRTTLGWKYSGDSGTTAIEAVLSGGGIRVEGVFRGKRHAEELPLGRLPWVQNNSAYLEEFVRSGKERCVFVSLKADDLKPYELEASRIGTESVTVNGRARSAVRLRMNLTGFASMFWRADYWFDAGTGDFLRYESKHGIPESTVIEPVE